MKSKYQLPFARERMKRIDSIARVAAGQGTFDVKGPYKGQTHSVHVRFKSSELFAAAELASFFANACAEYGISCVRDEHVVKVDPETVDVNAAA
jgi:hypothetical protein